MPPLINEKYGKTLVDLVYACIYIGQSNQDCGNKRSKYYESVTALRTTLHLFTHVILLNRAFANRLGFPTPLAMSQSQRG